MKSKIITQPREIVVEMIAIEYRRAKKHLDYYHYTSCVKENQRGYNDDLHYVQEVEASLNNCSKDTQKIIRHGYLEVSEPKWYLEFYTRSVYYRLRKKAIEEFLNCLDF